MPFPASDIAPAPPRDAFWIDPAPLARDLSAISEGELDPGAKRDAVAERLRRQWQEGRDQLAAALISDPYAMPRGIRAHTELTDLIVTSTWAFVTGTLHPNPNPTSGQQITLLAVGGYGRAEMAPFSDVDLLFLTPYKQTAWGESVIESILYILWDLRMKVGQAVRTVDECIRLGRTDLTIRTALLEHRFLAGSVELAKDLDTRLWRDLFLKTGPEFIEAKLEEREQRHASNGGSRYLVEPNIKEGKGGLRDLQTLFWIAKYLNRARTPDDLLKQGVFTKAEMDAFREAENFLWATRCQLHLVAGRPTEKMTFDTQVEIAERLGFQDDAGQRAVEKFMQTYFTHARLVGELTRIVLVALEAEHVKRRPRVGRSLITALGFGAEKVPKGYVIRNGRIDLEDPKAFEKDPVNILRLFDAALRTGYLIHADAMRRVTASTHLIDDRMRADPEANRIFMDLLLNPSDPERALRRMNEMGVLGAFIPEFGRIVAMMQFNMYHHYTVDEHIIQCIANLHWIEEGKLREDLPIASDILKRGVNRRVLYTALLLHDIGKGLPQDHSTAGADIAAALCPRLGLPEDEAETVVWLVRNHLLMSDTAQKRDLADPRTVRDFARETRTAARLKLLTVLTVCDIRGVGPGTWNNWKAMLLRALYAMTLEALTGESDRQTLADRVAAAKKALADALDGWPKKDVTRECARHYDPYWLGLDVQTHAIFADLMREVKPDRPALRIDRDDSRDATRVCFAMQDHPGLFSRLAGALAIAGANVVDARTYTSSDGVATPVFWIQDSEGKPFEAARLARLTRIVERTLKGEVVAVEAFRDKDKVKKREKEFIVPTQISFDNEGSEIFTMIEVDTRDRPGLLYDLARTLAAANISISSAIIATYGEQAVDTFYVKDLFGLKIHSKSKQDQIAEKLRRAIQQGAQRAGRGTDS